MLAAVKRLMSQRKFIRFSIITSLILIIMGVISCFVYLFTTCYDRDCFQQVSYRKECSIDGKIFCCASTSLCGPAFECREKHNGHCQGFIVAGIIMVSLGALMMVLLCGCGVVCRTGREGDDESSYVVMPPQADLSQRLSQRLGLSQSQKLSQRQSLNQSQRSSQRSSFVESDEKKAQRHYHKEQRYAQKHQKAATLLSESD